jgi:hypothetical protein
VKKSISIILILCFTFYIFGCSSSKFVDLEQPPAGESVQINLIDGSSKQGVLLKKTGKVIQYIDTETSKPEDLEVTNIQSIERVAVVYDLTGKPISETDIHNVKSSGKTWGYGVGGFLAGGLIGFGAGALYSAASDQSIALIYPIVGFGIAGAVFLGMKGSDQAREDAIDNIRKTRYEATQKQMQKELKEQEEELKKQQQELKEIKRKKNSGN